MADGSEIVQVARGEWEALQARIARLEERAGPDQRTEPGVASGSRGDDRTDRRGLLKHGAMLAAAAAAGGTALMATQAAPASATTGGMQFGAANDAGFDETFLSSESTLVTLEVINYGTGVALEATDGPAGKGGPLVAKVENASNVSTALAVSSVGSGNAVDAQITNAASTSNALHGTTNGTGSAVLGQINNPSSSAVAVGGATNGTGAAFGGLALGTGPAVQGSAWGTGPGVVAQVVSSSNSQPAVSASTAGTGAAVQGTASGTGSRGGVFGGVAAQLKLTPASGSTHPSSGQTGDLYVDATARLWFCTATGSPATWRQVQLA